MTPTRLGRYRLLEQIGRGGMAEVWRAVPADGGPGVFAVKRILPEWLDDPDHLVMFAREARLSLRLIHPHIVRVLEQGDDGGRPYLVMEHIDGRDLTTVIRSAQKLELVSVPLAAYVALAVCRALEYVHALTGDDGAPLGLIHRDVSPSNVMLGLDGSVKLLDFGIAKALASRTHARTATNQLKGKWTYMAPEQLEGAEVDARVDVYSLGVLFYEALTAQRLFHARSASQAIDELRAGPVAPPSQLNPEVPPAIDRICARALARRREDRYPSAAALRADLEAASQPFAWDAAQLARALTGLLAEEPTTAGRTVVDRPQPTPQPSARWLSADLAALAIVVLTTALAGRPQVASSPTAEPITPAASTRPTAPAVPVSSTAPVAAIPPATPAPTAPLPTLAGSPNARATPPRAVTPPRSRPHSSATRKPASSQLLDGSDPLRGREVADPFANDRR